MRECASKGTVMIQYFDIMVTQDKDNSCCLIFDKYLYTADKEIRKQIYVHNFSIHCQFKNMQHKHLK